MDHSKKSVAIFDQFALLYQDKFMDVSLYQDSLKAFCSRITTENPLILELACGPGNMTKFLLENRPDFKILATDLSAKMLELAAKNAPMATLRKLDCRKINTLTEKYHGIMASFCLPYLTLQEVNQLIEDCGKLLLNKGLLYLSTMEDEHHQSGYRKGSVKEVEPIMMHYYLESDIMNSLERNNFEQIFIDRKQYKDQSGNLTTDVILIARKK